MTPPFDCAATAPHNDGVIGPRVDPRTIVEQDRIIKKRTRAAPVHGELCVVAQFVGVKFARAVVNGQI
jgi:hypothetical protein